MTMLKPGRWTFNTSDVADEWKDMWRNLSWAIPLWEASGPPIAYPTRSLASTTDGVWHPTQTGIGHRLNETGSGDSIRFDEHISHDLVPYTASSGDVEFSIFMHYNMTGYAGGNPALMSHRDSFGAGYWVCGLYSSIGVNDIFDFAFHDGGGLQYTSFGTNSWPGTGYHTFCLTRASGGNYTLYVDGLEAATSTNSTSFPTTGQETHKLYLGELGSDATGNNIQGDYLAAYIWQGRVLTASDVLRLNSDPYGPFRQRQTLSLAPIAKFVGWGIPWKS